MLSRIFPKQFDNLYRGHRFGFWLFVLVVLMELSMGANSSIQHPHCSDVGRWNPP